jgi:hypothetical protein
VNCCVLPAGTVGFAGVTAIETRFAAVTVNCATPLTEFTVAMIVTGPPTETPFANPLLNPPLAMVAIAVLEEDQVTDPVSVCIDPSEYVPVAANCFVSPAATDAVAGDTAIDCSTAGVTVSCAVPLTPPRAAVIVTGPPAVTPVANPATLIVALLVLDEVQVTDAVRFLVELSE